MNQLLMAIQMLKAKKPGQGVVEYAGALIIAGLIVAAVVAVGPNAIGAAFQTIITDLTNLLNTNAGNI